MSVITNASQGRRAHNECRLEDNQGKASFAGLISKKLNMGTLCMQLSQKKLGQHHTRAHATAKRDRAARKTHACGTGGTWLNLFCCIYSKALSAAAHREVKPPAGLRI